MRLPTMSARAGPAAVFLHAIPLALFVLYKYRSAESALISLARPTGLDFVRAWVFQRAGGRESLGRPLLQPWRCCERLFGNDRIVSGSLREADREIVGKTRFGFMCLDHS